MELTKKAQPDIIFECIIFQEVGFWEIDTHRILGLTFDDLA